MAPVENVAMKAEEIKKALKCSVLSRRSGIYTAKYSYYWGFTKSGEEYKSKVLAVFSNAQIIDFGNHFHSFVGGAKTGSSQDSYTWIKFKL